MNYIGKKVYVKELGESGVVVNAKTNIFGMIVYKVKTKNFFEWSCYTHEMELTQ